MSEIFVTQICGIELQFLIKLSKESRKGDVYTCSHICMLLFLKFKDEPVAVFMIHHVYIWREPQRYFGEIRQIRFLPESLS